jgi:tRNA A-37 threonylcarbamoyl transferase component Bud32
MNEVVRASEDVKQEGDGVAGVPALVQAQETGVVESREETIVPYRPFAELEHWLQYRFSEKDSGKSRYFWTVAIIFFVAGGPLIVAHLLVWLLSFLGGTAGAGAAVPAQAAINVVGYFYCALMVAFASATAFYHSQPTHICLSDRGMRFLTRKNEKEKLLSLIDRSSAKKTGGWNRAIAAISREFVNAFTMDSTKEGPLLPWHQLGNIHLERPHNTPAVNEHLLVFRTGSKVLRKLRLGAFPTGDDRGRFLEGIQRWAPHIPREVEVIQALERPADESYTELWMRALSAPPKRERLKPLADGAQLRDSRYRVAGALGVGGQGTAYLAYDQFAGDETVVLKEFILPVYVDIQVRRQALEKFEMEAKILKQLDHPQIVKLIDFFIEDHRGYLVLEHIDGMSLRQKVDAEGKLPTEQVRQLGEQMCAILTYLHSLSPPVVHRDFTPDNLILRNDGTLKLVDFNVAQQKESTATGTVVGKHAYLPSEQFRGHPNTRSDLYAMGATLHFLLTGQDPEPISVSHPAAIEPAVPADLDRVVARATAIEAGDRYQSAQELQRALSIQETSSKSESE